METGDMDQTESASGLSRCAGCRLRRQKCTPECVLAPYFSSSDPQKFAVVHRVYGTSNVVKTLEGVQSEERADVVRSMVYEAPARAADPVHGCMSELNELQQRKAELKSKVADKQAELVSMRLKRDKLLSILYGCDHDGAAQVLHRGGSSSQENKDMRSDNMDDS